MEQTKRAIIPAENDKQQVVDLKGNGAAHTAGARMDARGGYRRRVRGNQRDPINEAIVHLKKKYPKPLVAVINSLGASAAYMIAMHADRIVAGKYSLVGSIGAIMAPWELHRAIAKVDVSQRVYASGKLKSFLNPFSPVTPEMDRKAKQLVDLMGQTFLVELRSARGSLLKTGIDYGSGEVWGGSDAKEIGLVDAIGTVDDVVASNWSGLTTYNFGPYQEGFSGLSAEFHSTLAGALERFIAQQNLQLR